MVELKLTEDEALMLDGKVSEAAQSVLDAVKRARELSSLEGVSTAVADFVSQAIEAAKEHGRLVLRYSDVRQCKLCGESGGYRKYTRSSRYHRKGDSDFSKPVYLYGVDLIDSFIRIKGSPELGCCNKCWESVKPVLAKHLEGVRAAIPEAITGNAPRFAWYRNRRCTKCGWTGHEGEMGRERTLMGDGTYPAGCPKCDARNGFLVTVVELAEGFTLVELTP